MPNSVYEPVTTNTAAMPFPFGTGIEKIDVTADGVITLPFTADEVKVTNKTGHTLTVKAIGVTYGSGIFEVDPYKWEKIGPFNLAEITQVEITGIASALTSTEEIELEVSRHH